jgi:2,4-diaminopentanoate dehydrogenase
MAINVVHWGTGTTGLKGLRGILNHPGLELVGLYVARPDRAGIDAGTICGLGHVGVAATNDIDALLATDADCLSYFGSGNVLGDSPEVVATAVETVARFLRAGWNVVTPAITSLVLPDWALEEERRAIDEACAAGSASFFATGVEPGFASDVLPSALMAMVDEIRCVKVSEIANYGEMPNAAMLQFFGFGRAVDDPIPLFAESAPLKSWSGVVHELAAELGYVLDDIELITEVSPVDEDVQLEVALIEKGTIGAIRFELRGLVDGHPLAILEHVNYIAPGAGTQWQYGTGGRSLVYRIEIQGKPTYTCLLDVDLWGDDVSSSPAAMRTVNAIPMVRAAAPGILGPTDITIPPRTRRNVRLSD